MLYNTQMVYILFLMMLCCSAGSLVSADQGGDDLFNYSKKQQDALVVKVVNADALVLENGQRVRLIGIESIGPPPRKYAKLDEHGKVIEEPEEATIPIEDQALTYAQELLEGKKVRLEYDVDTFDSDGYRLAYVYLPDGRLANAELLRMGFVHLHISPPNVKHDDLLRAAYQEAQREKRGLLSE